MVEDTIQKDETKIFRFTIGGDSAITSISITLSLGTTDSSKVQMFAFGQQDPAFVPKSDMTFNIQKTWLGYSFGISQSSSNNFKRDWIYKVAIKSSVETSFSLTYRSNKAITVFTGKIADVYEPIQDTHFNCYQYNVRDSINNLEIFLTAYSGKPRILVNPLTLPSPLNTWDFKFTSDYDGINKGVLSISPEERSNAKALTGHYYVCIYCERPSFYNMLIRMSPRTTKDRIPLLKGLTRSLSIKPGNQALFQYGAESKETVDITFTLNTYSWGSTFYVKFCGYNTYCEFGNLSSPDVMSVKALDSSSNLFTTFNPKDTGCIDKDCYYIIAVQAESSTYTDYWSTFTFLVTESTNTTSQLLSGIPYSGSLDLNEVMNFKFTVDYHEYPGVIFQLTPKNGMVDLTVNHMNSNDTNPTRYAYASSYYPEVITYSKDKGDNPFGEYNITLSGQTAASFELTAYIIGSSDTKTTLTDGHHQIGELTSRQDSMLFVFGIAFPNDKQNDIVISLLPIHGSFSVYVMANGVPSRSNFTWSFHSSHGNLFIRKEDPNYKRCGTYYVLVTKAISDSTANHTFSLKYISGKYVQNVIEGFPEFGNITKQDIGFYKYTISDPEETMSIVMTPLSGDSSTYVSVNGLPSRNSYMLSTSEIGSDILKIKSSDAMNLTQKKCRTETLGGADCSVFIGVFCASETCTYSLLLSRQKNVPIRLVSGVPQFGIVENQGSFYAFIPNATNTSTIITVQPTKGEMSGFVKLVDWTKDFRYDSQLNQPTNLNTNITLQPLATAEFAIIPASSIQACGKKCIIFISLFKKMQSRDTGEFTITASNGLNLVIEGQTIVDKVDYREFKYYMFSTYCRNCSIFVSLCDLASGNTYLYANKGLRFPTLNSFDFTAASPTGEILAIDPTDPFFNKSVNATQGIYTIGVYGARESTYSLAITTSETPYQELRLGIPTKQEQGEGEVKFFTFVSWKKNTITIRLAVHSGRVVIRANVVTGERDPNITQKFPIADSMSTWSSSRDGTTNYLVISKDSPQFLDKGVYLIGVEAKDGSNYDILAEYSNSWDYTYLSLGKPFRAQINATNKIKLAFLVNSFDNFTVKLDVLKGDVKGNVSTGENKKIGDLIQGGKLLITPSVIQNNNKLYLEIYANDDSDIILRIYPNLNNTFLDEGIPFSDEVVANTTLSFSYNLPAPDLSDEDSVRFNVFVKFDKPILNGTINVKQMIQVNNSYPPAYSWINTTINYNSFLKVFGDSILLNLSKSEVVLIDVKAVFPPKVAKANFTISAWTNGVIVLNPGDWFLSYQDDASTTQIFEQVVDQPANISIEISPCIGRMRFYVAAENRIMSNRSTELDVHDIQAGRLFGTFAAKPGRYFIYVTAEEANSTEDTFGLRYSIRSLLSYGYTAEIKANFTLENNGKITLTHAGGKMHLKWGKVINLNSNIKEPLNEFYTIYIADTHIYNMRTPCGIYFSNAEVVDSVQGVNEYIYTVPPKFQRKHVIINIIAYIEKYEETLTYSPLVLREHHPGRHWLYCKVLLLNSVSFDLPCRCCLLIACC